MFQYPEKDKLPFELTQILYPEERLNILAFVSPQIQELWSRALPEFNWVGVTSGREAVQMIREQPIDVMLLDPFVSRTQSDPELLFMGAEPREEQAVEASSNLTTIKNILSKVAEHSVEAACYFVSAKGQDSAKDETFYIECLRKGLVRGRIYISLLTHDAKNADDMRAKLLKIQRNLALNKTDMRDFLATRTLVFNTLPQYSETDEALNIQLTDLEFQVLSGTPQVETPIGPPRISAANPKNVVSQDKAPKQVVPQKDSDPPKLGKRVDFDWE